MSGSTNFSLNGSLVAKLEHSEKNKYRHFRLSISPIFLFIAEVSVFKGIGHTSADKDFGVKLSDFQM